MAAEIFVKKQSGEMEAFDPGKLHASLRRAGASSEMAGKVEEALKPFLTDGISTATLYQKAFQILRKLRRSTAARYSLKKGIMELGPSGYPFEHFVGALLKHMGYSVEVGKMIEGDCIQHEVDVVAHNDHQQLMVECKYYNSQSKQGNVKVPLYIHSRFSDIEKKMKGTPRLADRNFHGWVITNTRFTTDAIEYGRCAGLHMVSWSYPKKEGLKEMIENAGLFPITVLTQMNKKQKQTLLEEDIVLCRQILQKPGLLEKVGLTSRKREKILDEIRDLVGDRA